MVSNNNFEDYEEFEEDFSRNSSISGSSFNWAQGITTNHGYIKSLNLAYRMHDVYRNGMWFQKGVSHDNSFN